MQCNRSNQCEFTLEDYQISGIAAPYGLRSQDLGGFYEVIEFGAFERVLSTNPEVIATVNHSRNVEDILGTTKSGTLKLESTPFGLKFNLNIAQTAIGSSVVELIKRNDVSKLSFAFTVAKGGDHWSLIDGETIRTITDFEDIKDISIVLEPAYLDTHIE